MRAFEDILDPMSMNRKVDLDGLRRICSRGIPDQPPWIRPRVWKLLLGSLPPEKDLWATESKKSRERYYDLATQFLDEVERMPEPTYPLSSRDKLLDTIAKDVSRTQPRVPFFRSFIEPSALSPLSPLPHGFVLSEDDEEGTTIPQRIESAAALFERLEMIQKALRQPVPSRKSSLAPSEGSLEAPKTPQIRLSPSIEEENPPSDSEGEDEPLRKHKQEPSEASGPPSVSVTSPTSPTGVELLPSHDMPKPTPKHSQILLRILYLFSVTHLHQPYTQGLNELLAPLYLALCMDLDEKEAVHAEADAFWLFSEMIGEVGAVVGEPGDWRSPSPGEAALPVPGGSGAAQNGVKGAMAELSARLKWADLQLWEDLTRKSLDPRLPYYSYRWIACLLAQDLPIGTVLQVWDTVFAQPPSTPDSNPRISFLINICTSMLIRLRFRLIKTGNAAVQSGGLWDDEYVDADQVIKAKTGVPPTADESGVMGEGFVEGMQLLQAYPVQAIGIDMIIDGARDLTAKWNREEEMRARGPSVVTTVGNRLTKAIWNGITNTAAMQDEEVSDDEDEGQMTEKESSKAPTVQEIEQAAAKETPTVAPQGGSVLPAAARWRYAVESFKDSDAAAALSKNATNWRVAALDAWKGTPATSGAPSDVRSPPPSEKRLPDTPLSPTSSTGSIPSTSTPTTAAASKLRQYAEAFRSSDAAAQLSKTSTNWTAAALDRWNSRPALSSPLNPSAPPAPPAPPAETGPESARTRGGSLGSWTAWGAKAGSLLGGGKSGPLSPTQTDNLSPTWVPSQLADNRTSLPVPLRGRDPPSPQSHSRERSRSGDDRSTSPGLRPPKFANPRDSLVGWDGAGGPRDPIEEALAKARAERAAAEPRESSPEEGSTSSRIGKSLQSALASLSGSSRPPSPPPPVPVPPRPLMLGTAAAKTFASPTTRTAPSSSPRRPSADSRPSSISSNASSVLPSSGRSVTPTPNRASQSTIATSVRPDSPAGTIPSDTERKSSRDSISERPGFVPLRNGVGRQTGSTTIMRKSRAAQPRGRAADAGMENDSPLYASPISHETSPATPLSKVPELPKDVKKYALTDAPVAKPAEPQRYSLTDASLPKPALKLSPKPPAAASPSPAPESPVRTHADGYSSAGSAAGVPVLRPGPPGIRKKRMYVPKKPALQVMTSQHPEPDELGMVSHSREASMDEYGRGLRLPYMSDGLTTPQPLTPSASQLDALKTPTSADAEIRPRSPLRSPRRGKKVPSRPTSKVMSEEEGARADDEEGYEDLISAYSEDDGGNARAYAM